MESPPGIIDTYLLTSYLTSRHSGPAAHGDYVFGWEDQSLQKAMDNRCNLNRDCPAAGLHAQTPAEYNACTKPQMAKEDVDGCKLTTLSLRLPGPATSIFLTLLAIYRAQGTPARRDGRQGLESDRNKCHSQGDELPTALPSVSRGRRLADPIGALREGKENCQKDGEGIFLDSYPCNVEADNTAIFLDIRYNLAFWLYLVFLNPICKSTTLYP